MIPSIGSGIAIKRCSSGQEKLGSLKLLNIKKPPAIPGILTLATIRNGFLKILGGKTVKNVANRFINNVDVVEKAKCDVSDYGIYLIT